MINSNIMLFNSQKTHVRIIRYISSGDPRHQPCEKSKHSEKSPVADMYLRRNLPIFKLNLFPKLNELTMRYTLLIAITSLVLSCNNEKTADQKNAESATDKEKTEVDANAAHVQSDRKAYDKFLGSFVGPFGDNKITMLITRVTRDSVSGRTIVGGNDRPFAGTYTQEAGIYKFKAREPGDDKHDGEFTWIMDEINPDTVMGNWVPYSRDLKAKTFTINRKSFSYQPTVGDYPEASTRLLKPADVENLMKEDLEFMRNEIFARHGYCFNRKHLRQQYEMQDWYVPNTVDIKGYLTEIEKKNIAMIRRYEKYAAEYGDEYGR